MKIKTVAFIMILVMALSGCSANRLDTAQKLEFKYEYARLLPFGIQLELGDSYVVTQATNFTSKYMAVLYNRNYHTVSGDEEKILYSEHYLETHKDLDKYFENLKEFYTQYHIVTELSRTDVHHVIMIGEDAYVNLTAYVTLQDCINYDIAKQIGFTGIAGTISQEFNLKIQYKDKEYKLYDIERVKGDKNIEDFSLLAGKFEIPEIPESIEVTDNTGVNPDTSREASEGQKSESGKDNNANNAADEQKIAEVKRFISSLAARQNNRNYETMAGNEDYPLLSDDYIAALNKNYNDVEKTKQVYRDKQLSTELVSVNIKSIDVRKNAYIVNVDIVSKITHCISDDEAKRIGYPGGIGSTSTMSFVYTVSEINGSLKLVNSKQLR